MPKVITFPVQFTVPDDCEIDFSNASVVQNLSGEMEDTLNELFEDHAIETIVLSPRFGIMHNMSMQSPKD